MTPSSLDKYLNRDGRPPQRFDDSEVVDGVGCFGILRGLRERSPSIELRRKTGRVLVIGYHAIDRMEFDPSEGVTIRSASQSITLKGRNLAADIRSNVPLITALATQRVAWIQELGKTELVAAVGQVPVVESIEW